MIEYSNHAGIGTKFGSLARSIYNHQSLWETRQHPRVYDAFVDIWDREDLWVAIDGANLNPPNSLLAHGVRPNRSRDQVRMAQHISMFPADFKNERLRQARIKTWAQQTNPIGDPFPGDPREFEKKHFEVATLNPLGRRLLGLDRWS